MPKVQKQGDAKSDGIITYTISISINFNMVNFDDSDTLRIKRSRPYMYDLATCTLVDSLVHQQWQSPISWNIKKETSSKIYTTFYTRFN